MFKCHVCGSLESQQERVSEMYELEDKRVLVEGIPATVCQRCGEAIFSRETTERVRRMVHGEAKPTGTLTVEVFAFS